MMNVFWCLSRLMLIVVMCCVANGAAKQCTKGQFKLPAVPPASYPADPEGIPDEKPSENTECPPTSGGGQPACVAFAVSSDTELEFYYDCDTGIDDVIITYDISRTTEYQPQSIPNIVCQQYESQSAPKRHAVSCSGGSAPDPLRLSMRALFNTLPLHMAIGVKTPPTYTGDDLRCALGTFSHPLADVPSKLSSARPLQRLPQNALPLQADSLPPVDRYREMCFVQSITTTTSIKLQYGMKHASLCPPLPCFRYPRLKAGLCCCDGNDCNDMSLASAYNATTNAPSRTTTSTSSTTTTPSVTSAADCCDCPSEHSPTQATIDTDNITRAIAGNDTTAVCPTVSHCDPASFTFLLILCIVGWMAVGLFVTAAVVILCLKVAQSKRSSKKTKPPKSAPPPHIEHLAPLPKPCSPLTATEDTTELWSVAEKTTEKTDA